MGRYKQGNPKRQSRFICLKCMKENKIVSGLQRESQRNKCHIKTLYCLRCRTETQNLEVRYCDWYEEIYEKAKEIRELYYEREVV